MGFSFELGKGLLITLNIRPYGFSVVNLGDVIVSTQIERLSNVFNTGMGLFILSMSTGVIVTVFAVAEKTGLAQCPPCPMRFFFVKYPEKL